MLSGHASGEAVIAVVSTMTGLAVALVALRLYARIWVSKNAGWDDTFIVTSAVSVFTSTLACLVAKNNAAVLSSDNGHDDRASRYWPWETCLDHGQTRSHAELAGSKCPPSSRAELMPNIG